MNTQLNLKDGVSRAEAELLAQQTATERSAYYDELTGEQSQTVNDQLQAHIDEYQALRDELLNQIGDIDPSQASRAFDYLQTLEEIISDLQAAKSELSSHTPLEEELASRQTETVDGEAIFRDYELSADGAMYEISLEQNPFEETPQRIAIMLNPGDTATVVARNADEIVILIEDAQGNEAHVKIRLNGTDYDNVDLYIHGKLSNTNLDDTLKQIIHKGGSSRTIYEEENGIQASNDSQVPTSVDNNEPSEHVANATETFNEAWSLVGDNKSKPLYGTMYKEAYEKIISADDVEQAWDDVYRDLKSKGKSDEEIGLLMRLLVVGLSKDHSDKLDPVSHFLASTIQADGDLTAKDKAALLILDSKFWDEGLGAEGNWADDRNENIAALGIVKSYRGVGITGEEDDAIAAEQALLNGNPADSIDEQVLHLNDSAYQNSMGYASRYSTTHQNLARRVMDVLRNPDDLTIEELRNKILEEISDISDEKRHDDMAAHLVYVLHEHDPELFNALMADEGFANALFHIAFNGGDSPVFSSEAAKIFKDEFGLS